MWRGAKGPVDLCSARTEAERRQVTYAEIKDYVLKEHGLKVSNLYISQVKRKCGIEVGENYNLRRPIRRPLRTLRMLILKVCRSRKIVDSLSIRWRRKRRYGMRWSILGWC